MAYKKREELFSKLEEISRNFQIKNRIADTKQTINSRPKP